MPAVIEGDDAVLLTEWPVALEPIEISGGRPSVEEEDDRVTDLRYYSYLQILEEVESQNYWERRKV